MIIKDDIRVMLQIVASLTDDSRGILYTYDFYSASITYNDNHVVPGKQFKPSLRVRTDPTKCNTIH
jgi:hypothetical protein